MSLPSKYAPDGLSRADQQRTITVKDKRPKGAINYTVRTIENKINDAVENHTYSNEGIQDIEMIPMDDDKEVDLISAFVNTTRSSGNFDYADSMEIEEDLALPVSYESAIPYLIIDTNFILSHLNIIDKLGQMGEEYGFQIIIPIAVMRELDGLKKSTKEVTDEEDKALSNKSVGHLARWANDWIFASLAKSSSVVKGQKIRQKIDPTAIQDDAILDCCLYFKENYENSLVILLSNDKNLCLKALSNDILTVSYRKTMSAELIADMIRNESNNRVKTPTPIPESYINQSNMKPITHSNMKPISVTSTNHSDNIHEVAEMIYKEVQVLTLSVIHHCMKSVYGDDLDLIRDYDTNEINTLKDCAYVLIRFWFPVFQTYFNHVPGRFTPFEEDESRKKIKNPIHIDVPGDKNELISFIKFWSKVLSVLYKAEMDENQNKALRVLVNRWEGFIVS